MDTHRMSLAVSPLAPIGVAATALAACSIVALVDPNESGRYPVCPFLVVTGRWCPACGSLRAVHALLVGAPAQALGFNALLVATIPLMLYSYFAWALPRLGGPRPPVIRLKPLAWWSILAVVVVFWVLRNIPAAPFATLAP